MKTILYTYCVFRILIIFDNFVQIWPPWQKLDILLKMLKITYNIKIRTGALFCKKYTEFSKNIFWQMWPIFSLGEHAVHTTPFLCIIPVAWWFTVKK